MKAFFTASSVLVFWSILAGCTDSPRTYKIAVISIPPKLDPVNLVTISTLLVYSKIYYPLFSRDEFGALTSQFLDMKETKSLTDSFNVFRFCLKDRVAFSDGSLVSMDDLKLTLKRLPHSKWSVAPMTFLADDNPLCLKFSVVRPDRNIFDKFLTGKSTILKSSTVESDAPIGLGPYRIAQKSDKRLFLEAVRDKVEGDFKTVEFVMVNGDSLAATVEQIDDWNNLGPISIPPSLVSRRYRKIEKLLPKVYFLHVGIMNDEVRRRFSECFDRKDFIRTIELPVEAISGLIPKGVFGSNTGRFVSHINESVHAHCEFTGSKPQVRFMNFNPTLQDKMVDYFHRHNHQLPIKVVVESRSTTETNAAYSRHETFLAMYGLTADEPLPEVFFSELVHPEWTYPKPVGHLERLLKASLVEEDLGKKQTLLEQAHREVLESGFVVPLGQLRATLYYPKNLKNIRALYNLDIFPQVDRMRLARWYEPEME